MGKAVAVQPTLITNESIETLQMNSGLVINICCILLLSLSITDSIYGTLLVMLKQYPPGTGLQLK